MNSAAHDIALFIADSGIGIWGTDLFANSEPATPDGTITVYDYPGGAPDTDELDVRLPNFQVRIRDLSYPVAYAKHEAIFGALILPSNGIITATSRFSLIAMNSDIASLGRDGNQRYILVASYRARRTNKET